jgi:hypothetical protein
MNDIPTIPDIFNDPALREADARAAVDHFISGVPLDPAVAMRVCARAERVTAEVFRKFGKLNSVVDLVRELRSHQSKDQSVTQAANLAAMVAMLCEIEHLREERALYLDALYAAKRADQSAEPLPSLEELMRTTTSRVSLNL